MKRIDLDFVHRPRPAPVGIALLLAGLLAAGVSFSAYRDVLGALDDAESALARASRGVRPGTKPRRQLPVSAVEEKKVREVMSALSAPWETLFVALENSAGGVGLLAVEPEARSGRVRLTLEAKNRSDMLAWLGRARAGALADAVLVDHAVQPDAPGQPVRFTVLATWAR